MYGYSVFHEDILGRLIDNVRNGTNANTYIFEGQKGLCKHNAALLFAKSLVCSNTGSAPCCECKSCIEAQAGSHPDIITVRREKDRASLGIGPIRNMISESLITPFYTGFKVFIIDEGDLLTAEAQNAFLKIIEEPPSYAVFIIVCTDAQILLETVRSRSVIINFPPVSDDIVRRYIQTNYPEETRIDFLVRYCAGIPKAADNIIARDDFEKIRDDVLSLLPNMLSADKLNAYAAAEYFETNKSIAPELFDMLLMYLRDILVTEMGGYSKIVNSDKSDIIVSLAQKYTPELTVKAIDEIIEAKKMADRYVKPSAAALHAALKTVI
jgi:DNA polymerase-3 subunit delta'